LILLTGSAAGAVVIEKDGEMAVSHPGCGDRP
jgi:hypothetical protein